MITAELRGKLSRNTERMEDILTSNVFSFLKYSDRSKCLRSYLRSEFGLEISKRDAREAEFRFWYTYEDGTEPDVVLVVGNFYLLFEAKYLSGFGEGDATKDSQPLREAKHGLEDAELLRKNFLFVAMTADFYFKENRAFIVPEEFAPYIRWTSWQNFAAFLGALLEKGVLTESHEREFATDLYELLDRKNLRGFHGFGSLERASVQADKQKYCFYDASTSTSRGAFIGFPEALLSVKTIDVPGRIVFLYSGRELFQSLQATSNIRPIREDRLFWEVDDG